MKKRNNLPKNTDGSYVAKKFSFKDFIEDKFHPLFFKMVVVSEDETGKPIKTIEKRRSLFLFYLVLFVLIFGLCFLFFDLPDNVRFDQLGVIFEQLFVPSKYSLKTYDRYWAYVFETAIPKIWETIEMVGLATFIGTLISIPLYILASSNIFKSKWVYLPVRIIVNIFRTIPTFVLAIIGTVFFGLNEAAGITAMSIFTAGVLFKLMYEYVETCDMNPFEAGRSSGATLLQAYHLSIAPQVTPILYSNIIYTFEINIRASVILGFVGAGGIGQILNDAIDSTSYDKVGAILIPLFITVMGLQLLSSFIRSKVQ